MKRLAVSSAKHWRWIAAIVAVVLVSGCSAAFWDGVAQGLAAQNRAGYGQNNSAPGSSTSESVCVKYETKLGWSKGYKVNATVLKGSELNSRTSSFNYNVFSTYVVVFWGEGEASILELDYFFGSVSVTGHDATDQRGKSWRVSSGLCY